MGCCESRLKGGGFPKLDADLLKSLIKIDCKKIYVGKYVDEGKTIPLILHDTTFKQGALAGKGKDSNGKLFAITGYAKADLTVKLYFKLGSKAYAFDGKAADDKLESFTGEITPAPIDTPDTVKPKTEDSKTKTPEEKKGDDKGDAPADNKSADAVAKAKDLAEKAAAAANKPVAPAKPTVPTEAEFHVVDATHSWKGKFTNEGKDTDFSLQWGQQGNVVKGWGQDAVGSFEMGGTFDGTTAELKKTYIKVEGATPLAYKGKVTDEAVKNKITGDWSYIGAEGGDKFEMTKC